jgi:hypothetical protein
MLEMRFGVGFEGILCLSLSTCFPCGLFDLHGIVELSG